MTLVAKKTGGPDRTPGISPGTVISDTVITLYWLSLLTKQLCTVTEALVLRPLLEDRGHITESIRILVPIDRMKQKCFQITTKQVRRSQQNAPKEHPSIACSMLAVQQQKRLCRQFVDVSTARRGCHTMKRAVTIDVEYWQPMSEGLRYIPACVTSLCRLIKLYINRIQHNTKRSVLCGVKDQLQLAKDARRHWSDVGCRSHTRYLTLRDLARPVCRRRASWPRHRCRGDAERWRSQRADAYETSRTGRCHVPTPGTHRQPISAVCVRSVPSAAVLHKTQNNHLTGLFLLPPRRQCLTRRFCDWLTECPYYDIWQTAAEITVDVYINVIVCTVKSTVCNTQCILFSMNFCTIAS